MRSFGLLLHISSLPSAYGIGDLGPQAQAFVHILKTIGARVWQVLPLSPTEDFLGNSPYASPSAFAGNPLLISPDLLVQDGWLSLADLETVLKCLPDSSNLCVEGRVNFPLVRAHRRHLWLTVFEKNAHLLAEHKDFLKFCEQHDYWLHDYARFVCIKEKEQGKSWVDWPKVLRDRDEQALISFDREAWRGIQRVKFVQFLFFSQWTGLKKLCSDFSLRLLGDIPMYVTHDSADVWAAPELFDLDGAGLPRFVAGVPPDYFSESGQRWGNPVYRWDIMGKTGFAWWKQRFRHTLDLVDFVRLDHFRGFCAYWAIPAEEKTALRGSWQTAPGQSFWESIRSEFPELPFIAENLGVITPDVQALMQRFSLAGMHVLQFGFSGENLALNPNVPFLHEKNSVVYTGTHDNIPTRDWFLAAGESDVANLAAYVGCSLEDLNSVDIFLRLAFASVADLAIFPVQDTLNFGQESRMNTPGTSLGNWEWRLCSSEAQLESFLHLKDQAKFFGRLLVPATGLGERHD